MASKIEEMTVAVFDYSENDFNFTSKPWNNQKTELSNFDVELRSKWDKAMEDGHFRYHLDKVETKIIGKKKYVAQLNVKRATERRKPQEILLLNQPFDPKQFNFTKIRSGEILFRVQGNESGHKGMANGVTLNGESQNIINEDQDEQQPTDLVIINVSPLEYGNVLIVPDVYAMRPQKLTEYCVKMAIQMLLLSNHRGFHVGFNSLCAFSSVNHQHLHAYYLEHELYVESCPVTHIKGQLYELDTMPTKGFAFQLHGSSVTELAKLVFTVANYFQESEIAHNLFLTKGTVFREDRSSELHTIRIYLWPRQKVIGVKDEAAFNVALVELAGHLPIKVQQLYEGLTEESIENTIREAALEDAEYQSIKDKVIELCS